MLQLTHPTSFMKDLPGAANAALLGAQREYQRKQLDGEIGRMIRAKVDAGMSVTNARMAAKYETSAWRALDPRYLSGAALPEDATRLLTDEIIAVARRRPVLSRQIRAAGLVRDAGNLGNFTIVWQKWADQEAAIHSMDIEVRGAFDQPGYSLDGAPIGILHKDFQFGLRELQAQANQGIPLDTSNAVRAAELVVDAEEALVVNGTLGITWGGYTSYGATNHPNRITETTSLDFGTVDNIDTAFNNSYGAAIAKNKFGPFAVHVSPTQYQQMLAHPSSIDRTQLARMLDMPYVASISLNQFVADGAMVLVEMTSSTVQMAIAEDLRPVQWEGPGGFSTNLKIFEAVVPIWKVDAASQLGVVHKTAI